MQSFFYGIKGIFVLKLGKFLGEGIFDFIDILILKLGKIWGKDIFDFIDIFVLKWEILGRDKNIYCKSNLKE